MNSFTTFICAIVTMACLIPFSSTLSAAEDVAIERDVVYGEASGEKLLLDIYQPAGNDNQNAKRFGVVLVHGGGWEGGNRTAQSMVELAHELARAGYVAF